MNMRQLTRQLLGVCALSFVASSAATAGNNIWTRLGDLETTVNVVEFDPAEPNRLFAGAADGIYRSADGGESWQEVGGTEIDGSVLSIEIDPADPLRIYAGVSDGLYASNDGGSTWARAANLDAAVFSITAAADAVVYVGTFGRGVFRSVNHGASFAAGGDSQRDDTVFAIEAISTDTFYAGTARGLFVSRNSAQTWEALGATLSGLSVRAVHLSVDPLHMLVGTFTQGVLRSEDGGMNWLPMNDGLDILAVRSMAVDPSDESRVFVATSTGGFYRTIKGTQGWEVINAGLPKLTARDVIALPTNPRRIVGVGPEPGVWEISFEPESLIQLARSPVVFGETPVSNTRIRTLPVSNAGDADLQISSLTLGNNSSFSVISPEFPLTLSESNSITVRLQFLPQAGGVARDTLEIRSNDQDEPVVRIPLRGTGVHAELASDLTSLVFGTVRIGEFEDLTIELRNAGSAPVLLENALFEHAASFRVVSFEPQTLQPSERLAVPIRFMPFVPGGIETRLVFLTDSAMQPRFEIEVHGLGTAPDLTVLQSALDFGTVDVGSGKGLPLEISNSGNTEMIISRIEVDGDAFRVPFVTPLTLDPGELFTLTVTFLPLTTGDQSGTLTIQSDAPGPLGRMEVGLRGSGGALTLIPQEAIPLGPGPVSMIVGDWNLDGNGDVAVADSASGRIRVLFGDGSGAFPEGQRAIYPSGISLYEPWDEPVSIASASILGTAPDLVVADRVARTISILRNNGSGQFDISREDIYIGHAVADVHAMDLDADGDVDLAVADGDNPSVTLLFNNGRGTFNARSTRVVEATPSALGAGNLNSDGHGDLVVANSGAGTVSVLLSDRSGGYQARRDFAVGTQPAALRLVDYDADGDNDIIVANRGSMDIAILANDGEGSFTRVRSIGVGMRPLGLALSDLSADIFSDLVVAGASAPNLTFLENDGRGDFFAKEIQITEVSSRAVEIVNIDAASDTVGTNDILVLSAAESQLQVFLNSDNRRQDPPRPPEAVVAQDLERDLGRRVEVMWQAPDLDEQIGRTTEYAVFRSKSGTGPFVEIGSVTAGNRRFIDVATLGDTFYYNVKARNALTGSSPSDTVSAASLPSPFFELQLVNEPRLSIGDTLRVKAFITPAEHRIAGLSFYATFEDSALNLVQADSTTTGIVPFRPDSASLGNFSLLENRLQPGARNKINFSVASLNIPPGVDPIPLGEIWFRTTKDTVASISIDDDPVLNRQSAVVEALTGNFLLPFIPSRPTQVSISDFQVTGQVALEGRTAPNLGEQVSLYFVRRDGKPLESPLNDEDRTKAGIQYTLDDNGRFELVQIPKDTYRVFLKPPSHLQGRVPTDSVAVGDSLRKHLTFNWTSPVSSDSSSSLLAGDATDDNLINMADFGFWVRYFGTSSADQAVWSQAKGADFNRDNQVNNDDFFLFAQNFGRIGVLLPNAVQKKSRPRGWAYLDSENQALRVAEVGPIIGYALRLPPGAEPVANRSGTVWENRSTQFRHWNQESGTHVLVAESDGVSVDGDGVLAYLDMPADLSPELMDLEILSVDGRVYQYIVARQKQLPVRSALLHNYPNPFNPETIIPFAVAAPSGSVGPAPVTLEVFNVLGQKMRTLVSGELRPGYHRVVWDGRDESGFEVASGIYIYRLEVGEFHQSRRFLLVR